MAARLTRTLCIIMAAMLLALPPCVASDSLSDNTPRWMLSAPRVTLLICDPGSEIYELEGHAALRLDYSETGGPDLAINWGLFDFDAPNFVYRFVSGQTDYMAGAIPAEPFVNSYMLHGRSVSEYDPGLTSAQAMEAARLVFNNLRPENRVYRYNYVLDNCSTRPLAIIDSVMDTPLGLGEHPVLADGTSFRRAMAHYHGNYPWYQFGIDLALGSTIDRPEQAGAMTFAPVALGDMLRQAGHGPVAVYTPPYGRRGGPAGPTPWPLRPMTVCWALFAAVGAVTLSDLRRRRISRWLDALLYGAFGLTGCLVFFLVFISEHYATSPNWIALWLNPLALLVPIAIWLKNGKKMLIPYQITNFVALIALLVLWVAGVQSLNAAFLPLIMADMTRSATYLTINRWQKPTV